MKRLLAFLALCLPIYILAQGFGSFTHDQPYFAKDRVAGSSGPYSLSNDAAITFWLDPHTLTNGDISFWQDKIRGDRYRPDGSPPASYDLANQWVDNTGKYGLSVTNVNGGGVGFSLVTNTTTTFAYGFILLCEPGLTVNRKGMWDSSNSVSQVFGVNQSGNPANIFYPWESPRVIYDIPLNAWFDLVIMHTRTNDGASSFSYHYTNGVLVYTNAMTAIWTNEWIHPLTRLGTATDQQNGMQGKWRDIVVWTNLSFSSLETLATNLHFYRTNTYGP